MPTINGRAVVIGASMAGLAAARALADHFSEVTIVERDEVADTSEPRKGVPQGRHTHALLARGREILEQLFPGLSEEAYAAGAVRTDLTNEVLWFNHGVYLRNGPCDWVGLALSRPKLEGLVRRRLLALGNVSSLEGCDAIEPMFDAAQARVTGLRIQPRGRAETARDLPADLVVDASGRGSATPGWLKAMGFAEAREEVIKSISPTQPRNTAEDPGNFPARTPW